MKSYDKYLILNRPAKIQTRNLYVDALKRKLQDRFLEGCREFTADRGIVCIFCRSRRGKDHCGLLWVLGALPFVRCLAMLRHCASALPRYPRFKLLISAC